MNLIPRQQGRTGIPVILAACLGLTLASCGGVSGTEPNHDSAADSEAPASTVPEPRTVTVPSGTVLTVEFLDSVSSETSVTGDAFAARLVDPVTLDGRVVVRAGDEVLGTVVEAVPTKKIGGKASLNLQFTALRLASGHEVPLAARFMMEGKKQTGKDAATIGGATAGGAVLGRIIGHQGDHGEDGTSIGAVVGAAVGTAIAATNERDPVQIPSGTVVGIRIESPVQLPVT
jgi:hypothetical protein